MPKTILITGASSDIGTCLIRRIANEYDCILAHYAHHDDGLQELKKKIGDKLVLLQADFSDEADVLRMISEIQSRGLTPHHIIHLPAEKFDIKRFPKIEWSTLQRGMDISLRSVVLLAQEFLPTMKKMKCGKLVIILSSVINSPTPKYCAQYVCLKYALLGLVRALAAEYANTGICVNSVSPATVDTKFLSSQSEHFHDNLIAMSGIGRFLTTDEVSAAIEYLLSSAGDCINGQNITIGSGA